MTIPAGTLAGSGTVTARVATPPAAAPGGLQLNGMTVEINLVGTSIVGQVEISLPARPPAGPAPTLAYYNSATNAWVAVPSVYDAAEGTVTTRSRHLSVWTVLVADTAEVLSQAKDLLAGVFGTEDHAEAPICSSSSGAAAKGIQVTGPGQNLVRWCWGDSGASPTVGVVDNRGYAVELDYPASWSTAAIGDADSVETALIDDVAKYLTAAAAGQKVAIIAPGKGLQFSVPPGMTGSILVQPSVPAYLLSGLGYGVDTLEMAYGKLPGTKIDASKTAQAVDLMFAAKDCVLQLDELFTNKVQTAHDAGAVFRNAAAIATSCLADQWEKAYGDTGAWREFIVGVLLWLSDGIKLAFNGMEAAVDTVRYALTRIEVISTAGSPTGPVDPALYEQQGGYYFQTPSGNIHCDITTQLTCLIGSIDFDGPGQVCIHGPVALTMTAGVSPVAVCGGDPPDTGQPWVDLPYGATITAKGYICSSSDSAGVRCSGGGHTFVISRTAIQIDGQVSAPSADGYLGYWGAKFSGINLKAGGQGTFNLAVPCCRHATYPITWTSNADGSASAIVTGPGQIDAPDNWNPHIPVGYQLALQMQPGAYGPIVKLTQPSQPNLSAATLCKTGTEDSSCTGP